MEKFDLAVIGAGPGGYPAAIRASQLGASVVLIEREALGGTCLNWGCIPTKSLIYSSSMFRNMTRSKQFGVYAENPSFDYSAMIRNKNQVVARLRDGVSRLLKANGVTLFPGSASFAGRNRLSVKGGQGRQNIKAANIIIAAGSASIMPDWLPKTRFVADSRMFLDLPELPESLIIVGGGVIGCEFACMTAQLGVKVTMVEILPDILPALDPDISAAVRTNMEDNLGIRIVAGKPLKNIKTGNAGIAGTAGRKQIEADLLLSAVGRRPASHRLALKSAGVTANAQGFIETDDNCQTAAASVYAVGDIAGGPLLAHFATAQGIRTAERIAGIRVSDGLGPVPSCIFTSPEIGTVGLSEREAREQNRAVTVGRFPFAASGKALVAGESEGFVKWIADSSTDQLLGAQAVGPHATELIAEAVAALRFELTADELSRTVHAHPTLSEAWMEAAHAVHGRCIHAPPGARSRAGAGTPLPKR